jgi:hypothetical protein
MSAAFLFWNSVPPSGKDGEVFVEGLGQPSNKSCIFRNNEANLMTFYEDQQITEDVVEFPPGTELVRIVYNIYWSFGFFYYIVDVYATCRSISLYYAGHFHDPLFF